MVAMKEINKWNSTPGDSTFSNITIKMQSILPMQAHRLVFLSVFGLVNVKARAPHVLSYRIPRKTLERI